MSNAPEAQGAIDGGLRRILPIAIIVAISAFAAYRGLAFETAAPGSRVLTHWDEASFLVRIQHSVLLETPLPGGYRYPSAMHQVGLACLLPDILKTGPGTVEKGRLVRSVFRDLSYRHRVRAVLIGLALLAIPWTYAFALQRGASRAEALLAAALLGFSFELGYHIRWIASDPLLMQFGILSALCLARARGSSSPDGWLGLAAAAAGFGCGSKYPGGLLLLPVLAAAILPRPGETRSLRRRLAFAAAAATIFALAFAAATPGCLWETDTFVRDVEFERNLYGNRGFFGYTVEPGIEPLGRILIWIALSVFSPWAVPAAGIAILVLIGLVATIRRDRGQSLFLLGFPAVYIAFFCLQKVLVVRNFMIVLPFLAILAARGAQDLAETLPRRGRCLLAIALAAILAANAAFLVQAGESIRQRNPSGLPAALSRRIDRSPGVRFLVTPRLESDLAAEGRAPRANVGSDPLRPADVAAFYASDVPSLWLWTANRYGYVLDQIGPDDVNLDYYPSWFASERIFLLGVRDALALGVFVLPIEALEKP
ncbi:MAG: phospholipid carrier-dependent glycosyltransferase [Planctomycetota bacterium]